MELARQILEEVRSGSDVSDAVRRHPHPEGGYIGKNILVAAYREIVDSGEWKAEEEILAKIRKKPIRTLSGVTTVTVLTKPYPCPGECIFCPDRDGMPKSYLPDEPGAMRALQHKYDPYNQVDYRIKALRAVGHPTDKIELLILGGSWSSYKNDYQEWFIRRCFDAMNGFSSDDIDQAFSSNEESKHRNVGIAVETRPDLIDKQELSRMRSLGVTKIQMGVQSLDDSILAANKRGHTVEVTRKAAMLLRAAGYKIVAHWMPNLLDATVSSDRRDFDRLWDGICPDELKIYPTQLLEDTELHDYWLKGEFKPYSTEELIDLIVDTKSVVPRYCRINRIVRDIPSTNIVEGNKRSSLRQDIQREIGKRDMRCECIRCREVRDQKVDINSLQVNINAYNTTAAEENFISFNTIDDKLAGFLRLSLPGSNSPDVGMQDLNKAAIIREVHIYGQSLEMGDSVDGAAQHSGLGTCILKKAEEIARDKGYQRLSVISAVGTRQYYLDRGFKRGELYITKKL